MVGGICHYLHSAATMVVRHTAAPGHPDKLHWTVHNSGATSALPGVGAHKMSEYSQAIRQLVYHLELGQGIGLAGRWEVGEEVERSDN